MTSGARHFGDSGRRLGDADAFLGWLVGAGSDGPSNKPNSKLSSSIGPEIPDIIVSPNMCCLQLLPGALIERS